MNWFYKYGANDWVLLEVAFDIYDEPTLRINEAASWRLAVPWDHYSILADGMVAADEVAWDASNTDVPGMLVVACANSVEAADLNADFDAVNKLILGHVTAWETDEKNVYLECEEWHAPWLREKITVDDNIRPEDSTHELLIDGFANEKTTIRCINDDASAVDWDNDFHNSRTARVVAKESVPVTKYITATPSIYQEKSNAVSSDFGTLSNMWYDDSSYCYASRHGGVNPDHAETEFSLDCYLPIPRWPAGDVTIKIKASFEPEATLHDNPSVTMYLADMTTLASAVSWEATDAQHAAATGYAGALSIEIRISKETLYLYYDVANERLRFRIYSGISMDVSSNYASHIFLYRVAAEYNDGYQHASVEWQIADTKNDDELELSTVADEFDTKTEKINNGDSVYILYKDDEFLEDILDAYILTDRISGINSAACTLGTFSDFNYMQVYQHAADVCLRNKLYHFLSRSTSGGLASIEFAAKASPPSSGLTITPANLEKSFNTRVRFNALDKVRAVITKNATMKRIWNGVDQTLPAVSIYPLAVLDNKLIPSGMLLDIAKAFQAMRNGIATGIKVTIKSVYQVLAPGSGIAEDFEDWVLGGTFVGANASGAVTWSHSVGSVSLIEAGQIGKISFDAVDLSKAAIANHSIAANDWVRYRFKVSNLATNYYHLLGDYTGGEYIYGMLSAVTDIFSIHDAGGWHSTFAVLADTWYTVKFLFLSTTEFRVYLDPDGANTPYPDAVNHYHTTGTLSTFKDFQLGTFTGSRWMKLDDFRCSWDVVAASYGDGPVQESAADEFYLGASLHCHLCPTDVDHTDYAINADAVIRSLKWLKNECAECELGFSEQDMKSLQQVLLENIIRSRFESTK